MDFVYGTAFGFAAGFVIAKLGSIEKKAEDLFKKVEEAIAAVKAKL